MGCGNGKQNTLDRPQSKMEKLTVWGDYFSPDTRTILTALYIAGVPHLFNEIDQFKNEHKKEDYLS
jgi:hypothetical protein